jgi:ATP-dependent protease ClpP protease subunit
MLTQPHNRESTERAVRVARALNKRRDWYRIENATADEASVYIYDEIGYWGLTAADLVRDLQSVKAKRINLHLNSPGGEVFDGWAIYTALKQHPATVAVQVDGLAASIASVIAMAGDTVTMAKPATLMIHDAYGFVLGNAAEMQAMAEVLDKLSDQIAAIYAERAGGSVREWRDRMRAETWYTEREAVDAGLADEVDGDSTAENRFDLSIFKHPPEGLLSERIAAAASAPTKRDVERALRDAGLTRSQAKALVAKGWEHIEPEGETREASDLLALRDALAVLI